MRILACLCLASSLVAGDRLIGQMPEPGRDAAFLARILGDTEGGTKPWRAFKAPAYGGSAVVEVVGELTREELRQVAFNEFLAWFHADLRRFLHRWGGPTPEPVDLAAATLPVERFGGNPLPRNVPLFRGNF
jgi:hypothetical protein